MPATWSAAGVWESRLSRPRTARDGGWAARWRSNRSAGWSGTAISASAGSHYWASAWTSRRRPTCRSKPSSLPSRTWWMWSENSCRALSAWRMKPESIDTISPGVSPGTFFFQCVHSWARQYVHQTHVQKIPRPASSIFPDGKYRTAPPDRGKPVGRIWCGIRRLRPGHVRFFPVDAQIWDCPLSFHGAQDAADHRADREVVWRQHDQIRSR